MQGEVKMETGYCLLITFTLLSLLSTRGFTLTCGAYNERPHSTDIEQCIRVEKAFENALLNNESNLYILRTAFLSSSNPSPHMLNVNYSFKDSSSVTALWSSSRVFTIIDPTILHNLQSGIMAFIYHLNGILFPQTIYLYLNFPETQFSQEECNYGILTITEKLKPYTVYQGKLSNWDGQDKGYVLLLRSSTRSQLQVAVVFSAIASTVLIVIVEIVYTWKFTRWLSRLNESYDSDIKLTLFWSFIYVIFITNAGDTIFSLHMMNSMESNKIYIILKIACSIILAAIGIIIGLCTAEKDLPKFPTPPDHQEECCLPMWCRRKTDHTIAMCNIFLFIYLTGISVISTTALMVVHPILVMSTVAYVITSMFSIVALLALTGLTIKWLSIPRDCADSQQISCSQLCNGCLQITAIIAMSLIILIYLIIMSKDDRAYSTSTFLQGISSFLPSIVLTVISYFAKNKLTANKRAKYDKKLRKRSFSSTDSENESGELLHKTEVKTSEV